MSYNTEMGSFGVESLSIVSGVDGGFLLALNTLLYNAPLYSLLFFQQCDCPSGYY